MVLKTACAPGFLWDRVEILAECADLLEGIRGEVFFAVTMTDDDIAKIHILYMVGGSIVSDLNEMIFDVTRGDSIGAF